MVIKGWKESPLKTEIEHKQDPEAVEGGRVSDSSPSWIMSQQL